MIKNNDYTTGNLLDFEYFSKHYRLIAIHLSKLFNMHKNGNSKDCKFTE